MFATNDVPSFQNATKGSEADRTLVLYLPNRFRSQGEPHTSPRAFQKDLALEDEVATNDFAIGLLMNLLQVRKQHGQGLGHTIGEGTPTSNFWRDAWVNEWSGVAGGSSNASMEVPT